MFNIVLAIITSLFFLVSDVVSNTIHTRPFRRIRQADGCILPPHPQNGYWTVVNGEGDPRDKVPKNSILEFACNENFRLSNNSHIYCSPAGWVGSDTPQCQQLCPPMVSTSKTILQCFNQNGIQIDCREAPEGSYMKYDCTSFYEPLPGQRKIIYCIEGMWSNEKPVCQPICGKKVDAAPLAYNGKTLKNLVYPWIVAIYQKENGQFINICGGTIIHRKVVLTAAHCVTDEYANPYPAENYEVAAAKLYNKYRDSKDAIAQYLKLSHIAVHPQFKGESRRFLGDIALLITKEPFKLGSFIKPVCINDIQTIHLYSESIGEIAGWGVTETGLQAVELKALEIPYKDSAVCDAELPNGWAEKYDVIDKMCAGSPEKNVSVCKGDSGSGLVFKNVEDNRYYVHGIVSLAPTASNGLACNVYTNALYTRVPFYYDFIDGELLRQSQCRLPNYPRNGKWILEKSTKNIPGNNVSPYDILKVECDDGYELTVEDLTMDCETLVATKPACKATSNLTQITSTTPIITTSRKYTNIKQDPGVIDVAECGEKANISHFQISIDKDDNDDSEKHLDSPWTVLVFEERRLRCVGTILSKRLVITAARAISNYEDWTNIDHEKLTITTGKYYSLFADPRDSDAQYYGVEKIYNFNGFKGIHDGLYGDMGFLVVKDFIEFSQWAKPICLKGVKSISIRRRDSFELVGWTNNDNFFERVPHQYEVAYKTISKCLTETPALSNYVSQDSVCGGSLNSSFCVRDLGSGLVYKNPADRRYYLMGIFAFSLTDCINNNTFYVSTKYHYNFIIEQIEKYS